MMVFIGRTTKWHGKTDQELRWTVAERIGWRAVEHKKNWYVIAPKDTLENLKEYIARVSWGLKEPKGFGYSSVEAAQYHNYTVPYFYKSVDAMLKVFKDHGCQWKLWNDYKEYFCSIDIFKGDSQFPIAFTCVAEDTPARAMCVAFLCWLEKESN